MEYQSWNKFIFEYFFNKTSIKTDVLFSVDKYVINEIGQKNNVKNPLLDFCNAINKYTVVLNNRERPSFQVSSINTNIENGVPMQTAVIAFLVLAASKMGEDVLNNNAVDNAKVLERNYYTQLKKLLNSNNDMQNIEFKSFGNIFENNFEKYKQLFSTFSEYVEQNYNCKVEFRELFKNKKRKSNDWIGIPIFQSMISSKDYALLTQIFEKYQFGSIINIKTLDLSKFSKVFNIVINDYPLLLQNRINTLFENWDGNVINYNETGERIIKPAKRNIYPSVLYEQNYGRYNFYEIIPKIKNLDTSVIIKTDEQEYTWNSNLEAYCSKSFCIHNNYFKTCSIKTSNDNLSLVYNLTHKKWTLLFKYENGVFKSVDNAMIGDTISFLCKTQIKTKYIQMLKNCVAPSININVQEINDTYSIIGPLTPIVECPELSIKDMKNISLIKGLKNGYKSEYLKGGEPILLVTKKSQNSKVSCKLDDVFININNLQHKIDLRIQNNSLGEHYVQLLNSEEKRKYTIVDSLDKNPANNTYKIYVRFIENKFEKITDHSENTNNLINGCYIENYKLLPSNKICINYKKDIVVNNILKAIYKKNKKNEYKKLLATGNYNFGDNITLRYLQELEV